MKINIEVFVDECPESPREWDNLGTMVSIHNRYDLGDPHTINKEDFDSWDEIKDYIVNELGARVILPLYLYDHSGLRIKTTPFGCKWDSGQVGWIYATRKDIKDYLGVKYDTNKIIDNVVEQLNSEVTLYDQYLSGEQYGYNIEVNGEYLDSCGGYYHLDELKNDMKLELNNFINDCSCEDLE